MANTSYISSWMPLKVLCCVLLILGVISVDSVPTTTTINSIVTTTTQSPAPSKTGCPPSPLVSTSEFRSTMQKFADTYLKDARKKYSVLPDGQSRFDSIQQIYQSAVESGLILAQIPTSEGGTGEGLTYGLIMAEELYPVDPSVSMTIFGTGLGLSPLLFFGNSSQKQQFLKPFLSKQGTPLASFVVSEVGGNADWWTNPSTTARGTQTFIERVNDDHWVLNGEKTWSMNSGGWSARGADLMCVVCRTKGNSSLLSSLAIVIVTRSDIDSNPAGAFKIVDDFERVGHHALSGPRIKFTNLRIPAQNILCEPGTGAEAMEKVFTPSACMVAGFSIGFMRAAFEKALFFARSDTRNGNHPIIQYQSVSDLLLSMKTKIETSRGLVARAVELLESQGLGELASLAKIYCSESAVEVIADAMKVVGVDSYRADFGFGQLMEDALAMPICDGGNVGVRRRQVQKIFESDQYNPRVLLP